MFGMRMATAKASPAAVLPSSREATVSRPRPAKRLAAIPSATIVEPEALRGRLGSVTAGSPSHVPSRVPSHVRSEASRVPRIA